MLANETIEMTLFSSLKFLSETIMQNLSCLLQITSTTLYNQISDDKNL